jgi:very-short-patch-repair endonuclease
MPWNEAPQRVKTNAAKANARRLRRAMTDAEKVLWKHIRGDFAGAGTHFRKQVAIGQYVADFCCLSHRLIVELDGPIHESASAKSYDRSREETLRADGYRVLRFFNSEVALDIGSVLNRIASALAVSTPTPGPSPQGGGVSVEATR